MATQGVFLGARAARDKAKPPLHNQSDPTRRRRVFLFATQEEEDGEKKKVSGTVFEERGEEGQRTGELDADGDEFACRIRPAFAEAAADKTAGKIAD